jgi:hypothetical protein
MSELGEFLPLLFGCVVGVLAGPRAGPTRLRIALVLCVALGPMASLVNGEIGDRSFLIVFDIAQVLVAFGLTAIVVRQPRAKVILRRVLRSVQRS